MFQEAGTLTWLLRETFEPQLVTADSALAASANAAVVEVGPRSTFSTAWSTNAVSICRSTGLSKVARLEESRRYLLNSSRPLTEPEKAAFAALVHDR